MAVQTTKMVKFIIFDEKRENLLLERYSVPGNRYVLDLLAKEFPSQENREQVLSVSLVNSIGFRGEYEVSSIPKPFSLLTESSWDKKLVLMNSSEWSRSGEPEYVSGQKELAWVPVSFLRDLLEFNGDVDPTFFYIRVNQDGKGRFLRQGIEDYKYDAVSEDLCSLIKDLSFSAGVANYFDNLSRFYGTELGRYVGISVPDELEGMVLEQDEFIFDGFAPDYRSKLGAALRNIYKQMVVVGYSDLVSIENELVENDFVDETGELAYVEAEPYEFADILGIEIRGVTQSEAEEIL